MPFVEMFVAPDEGRSEPGAVGQPTAVDADELLFAEFGSVLVDVTVAVFVIVAFGPAETLYVALMVLFVPAVIVPMLHGSDEHAPVAETNVRRAGGVSLTTTPDASAGPLLKTVIV